MSKSKDKGTKTERALANALKQLGWPEADRKVLEGRFDKGDITNTPGLCFEAKDAVVWDGPEWMRETETERVNAGADYGILVIKAPGVGYQNAHKWCTVMAGDAARRVHLLSPERLTAQSLGDGTALHLPALWEVEVPAMGFLGAWTRLVAEEKRHPGEVVSLWLPKRMSKVEKIPGYYNLMRLDARCRVLAAAGYGTHESMG